MGWGGGGSGDPNFFLHISSSLVKIRLYTENQLPRLLSSVLTVWGGWVGWVRDQLCSSTKLLVELIWVVTILKARIQEDRSLATMFNFWWLFKVWPQT